MVQLAVIVGLGVGCQWIGARIGVPSILLLLAGGILVGPVSDVVEPDALFGPLLFPGISLGVGILLFEGGLALRRDEVGAVSHPLARLVTIGAVVTWLIGAATTALLFDVTSEEALLTGAILVVSGPTVVLPLLRIINARPASASLLRWEGIVIDPIGAILAVVVLEAALGADDAASITGRILATLGGGAAVGFVTSLLLIEALARHWIPDRLQTTTTLGAVMAAFTAAEQIQVEAGLTATTVMGIMLANQRRAPAAHIKEFGEDLGVIVLGSLFIVLGARVDLDDLAEHLAPSLIILAVLVVIARPLAVLLSTWGTNVPAADRRFAAAMAPRGIVAAAVGSLFALELEEHGTEFPELVPIVFTVIVGSVIFYGLTGRLFARAFRVARAQAKGVVLVGGSPWVIDIADKLTEIEVPCLVVTSEEEAIVDAATRGVLIYTGKVDSEELITAAEGVGASVAIALASSDELNALAVRRLSEVVGRSGVFRLRTGDGDHGDEGGAASDIATQPAFGEVTRSHLESVLADGGRIVAAGRTPGDRRDYLPLVVVDPDGTPRVAAGDEGFDPGEIVIALVGSDANRRFWPVVGR